MKYYFYLFYINRESGQDVLILRTLVKSQFSINKERWYDASIPHFINMVSVDSEAEAIKKSKYKNCSYANEEEMKIIFAEHKLRQK
jgi:hypothetical protein